MTGFESYPQTPERVEIPGVLQTMQWQNPAALKPSCAHFPDRHAA
jgi:hypothetical protein